MNILFIRYRVQKAFRNNDDIIDGPEIEDGMCTIKLEGGCGMVSGLILRKDDISGWISGRC